MTGDQDKTDGQGALVRFDIYVSEEFVLIELAGLLEVLSIANRVGARPLFEWHFLSAKGGAMRSRTGVIVETEKVPARISAEYLFVLGNSNPDNPALSVGKLVSDYTFRGAQVFLLAEAASRYIAEHGDRHAHLTTHWENSALLRERGGVFEAGSSLVTEDGRIVTCAGMESTIDLVLWLMGRHVSKAQQMTIADVMLHERIRDFSTQQPFSGVRGTETGDAELDECIELMRANIEEPLPIKEIVALLGISSRSLERKFRDILGSTPNTYYRELRMARANNLLMNTTMSVRDIGLACGFATGFSGLYKSFFGITPAARRKARGPGPGAVRRLSNNS
ncbi:GlxA family transcriptional regulator [Shimia aestuarii]|uniref:Transcriptional regulator, AraC family n=1 Tax=Shimia aestuarii TaxID=254406 RepID=A0A1I4MU88_9RHOB|nr:helix-turn-helix domain-containing protein [Shimia aestuarii]SFM06871.1 transcriptional regulator, AraC family [Shimia aestuarii]